MKIFVRPTAGLCNRMRVIATAYEQLKEKDPNGIMKVFWFLDSGLNCRVEKLFNLPNDIQVVNCYPEKNFINTICNIILRVYLMLTTKCVREKDVISARNNSQDIVSNRVYIVSYEHIKKNFLDSDYSIFQPTEEIKKLVKDRIQTVTDGGKYTYIGLHIRRTDNNKSINQSSSEMFYTILDKYFAKYKNARVYVASDSLEEIKMLEERYNTDTKRIFFSENGVKSRDTEEGIMEAYVELLTLANAEVIYGSFFSSYSDLAAAIYRKKRYSVTSDTIGEILDQI